MWIVFSVEHEHKRLWAWCRPSSDDPGFDLIACTLPDGFTLVDAPEGVALGAVLFTVPAVPS